MPSLSSAPMRCSLLDEDGDISDCGEVLSSRFAPVMGGVLLFLPVELEDPQRLGTLNLLPAMASAPISVPCPLFCPGCPQCPASSPNLPWAYPTPASEYNPHPDGEPWLAAPMSSTTSALFH